MQAYMKIEFSIISVVINKLIVLWSVYYLIFFSIFWINSNIRWYQEYWLLIIFAIIAIWMFINMILNYFYAKKLIKISLFSDFDYIKKIFFKTLPYWIALFLSVVYTKIDIILLSFMEHWRIAERSIALYSLPLKIMDVFMIIWWFYMNSILPSLAKNFKTKNLSKIELILKNSIKLMFSIWIIIISLWFNYKNSVIKIIANDDYLQITNFNNFSSDDAFWIILFMILFFYLWIVFSYSLIALDKQKKLLRISIILTFINIFWNIILIPYLSFIWAAISTVITQIFFLLLVYKEINNYIIINLPLKYIFISSIFGVLSYFIIKFLLINFSIWLYLNFIYWLIIFFIYSFFMLKFAKK
jgi:O-antigen/teichoic acid export membrane protein